MADDVYAYIDIPGVGQKRVLVTSFGDDVLDYGSLNDVYVTLNSGKRALITLNTSGGGVKFNAVANYAALPDPALHADEAYIVLASTGLNWNRRRGVYRSDGVAWSRLSNVTYQVLDSEASFHDDADTTKILQIELSNVPTASTKKIIMADRDVDLQDPTFDSVVSNGVISVPSDTKITFNGVGGNTYIIYNSTSGDFEIYKNGTKVVSW